MSDGVRHLSTVRHLSRAVAVPRLELVVEQEAGTRSMRSLVLDGDRFRLGSHPSNELVLDDPKVSRFHCVIQRGATGWAVQDEGSLNGTHLQGVRVRDADLPIPDCRLQLGDSVVHIRELRPASVTEIPDQPSFGDLWGESIPMRKLFGVLGRVAHSDATVLIEGESGTGKELVASEIVSHGSRAGKPFVVFDCGAVSPNVIESELFGHLRGAFTGADRARVGAFEAADGGTLFLDEIGELPLEIQPKLLRVLEAREVRRIGENTARRIDVRVVAATNRILEREVNRGRFREDLFFRLSVVTVRVPPLRERLDDLQLLVTVLLRALDASQKASLFTPAVLDAMSRYDWPGNVRELRNYVERAIVLDRATAPHGAEAPSEEPEHRLALNQAPQPDALPLPIIDLPFRAAKEQVISHFEQRYLSDLLAWADGNVSKAARKAQIDRMHLHRLVQRYGLKAR